MALLLGSLLGGLDLGLEFHQESLRHPTRFYGLRHTAEKPSLEAVHRITLE